MITKMNKVLMATTVSAALLAGSQIANAGVYGVSYLDIDDLEIVLTETGLPGANVSIPSFNFNTTNTAFLNDIGGATSASCSGTPASNSCNSSGVGPALDAPVYNAPGSAPLQGENNFSNFGPGTDQYSHADSVINTAELVNLGVLTDTTQVAQSEIQTADSANSNATLSSGTELVISIILTGGSVTLDLSFLAEAYVESDVNLASGTGLSASDVNVQFNLSSADDGGVLVLWTPQGTAQSDCAAIGGPICTEDADGGDLNRGVNAGGDSDNETYSTGAAAAAFGITVTGLTAGEYTLTLSGVTKTNLSRVPVPGTLMLLGLGLLGMVGARKKIIA